MYMASILNKCCPPCIHYSGKSLKNIAVGNDGTGKYDGTSHIAMAYRLYRWYDGIDNSTADFIRLYTNWSISDNKQHQYYFGSNPGDNIEQRCKSLCNGFNKKRDKNPKYCTSGCNSIVYTSSGVASLCYLCPFSPEYMNARIEYENTVLGYALLQLDTSFVDIIFNNVAGADYIYYENIATHFTGMYPVYNADEICTQPYNFNALVAYYLIRRVKDIESGNIEPRLKEVSQKALQGPNAIINTFMNILYEESQTLAADGSGYKRDTKVDYSINVSQSDAVSSFCSAISSIVLAGLSASQEDYEAASRELTNVYSYNGYFKKNIEHSKPDRYFSSLGVGDVTLTEHHKKTKKKKNHNTTNTAPGDSDILSSVASGKSKSNPTADCMGQESVFDALSFLTQDTKDQYAFFVKDTGLIDEEDAAKDKNISVNTQEDCASDELKTSSKENEHSNIDEQPSVYENFIEDMKEQLTQEDSALNGASTAVVEVSNSEDLSKPEDSYNYGGHTEVDEHLENLLASYDDTSIEDDTEYFDVTPDSGELSYNILEDSAPEHKSAQNEILNEKPFDVAEGRDTTSIQEKDKRPTMPLGDNFTLSSGFVPEGVDSPDDNSTSSTSEINEDVPVHSVYELSGISIRDYDFGEIGTAYGLSDSELIKKTALCQTELNGTEPIVVEYAYDGDIDTYGILVYTGREEKFWFIIEQSYQYENILYRLFSGERIKLCMNYPAIQNYLGRHGFRSNNLVSLPAMYAAAHPDIDRLLVNNVLGDMVHTASHPLKQYMLNYKGCYYNLKRILDTDTECFERYKNFRYLDDVMAASYDISDITNICIPGITTYNYSKLSYRYKDKEQLIHESGYCVLTALLDKACLYGINGSDIMTDIVVRLAKGHIFSRYKLRILSVSDCQIAVACPISGYSIVNDIIIDFIKKACRSRDDNKSIVPKITITNELA